MTPEREPSRLWTTSEAEPRIPRPAGTILDYLRCRGPRYLRWDRRVGIQPIPAAYHSRVSQYGLVGALMRAAHPVTKPRPMPTLVTALVIFESKFFPWRATVICS